MPNQLSSDILMIRPANFGYNPETADNNAFQVDDKELTIATRKSKAIEEFDAFVEKLKEVGINVIVMADTETPLKTDATFPNNWISFHEGGLIITYPMFSPNRRLERRQDIIDQLAEMFTYQNHVRLERWEQEAQYLESTGSLILDRVHKIAYACLSERTHSTLLEAYCQFMGFQKVAFSSVDKTGRPIYHTNVMMAMGTSFVVICMESIEKEAERANLKRLFKQTQKEIISISLAQLYAFAGNMLQVKNKKGDTFLVMSSQAYQSLTAAQIQQIEAHTQILHSDLTTIETYGGGSARCMMAEVFLEAK